MSATSDWVAILKTGSLLVIAGVLLTAALLSDDIPPPDSHPSWADIDACADALRECRIASSPAQYPLCVRISEPPFRACMLRTEPR